ncbi:MAG: response regulator [Calditrichia bacterium]
MSTNPIKVLLIEDDEDDFILVRSMLSEARHAKINLEWAPTYESGLELVLRGGYDVLLLDYQLGLKTGLELLQEMKKQGMGYPVIFLTGQGDYEVDVSAMREGAVDYLVKGQINVHLLERSIRYAVERNKTGNALRESERQLKYLSSQLMNIQEKERKYLALELHDGIAQTLAAVKFSVERSISRLNKNEAIPEIKSALQSVVNLVNGTISDIRKIQGELRPLMIDHLGVLATVEWFCSEYNKIYPNIRIENSFNVAEEEIPNNLKIVIYRIIQEALNNVAKHSGSDSVRIDLNNKEGLLELMIRDYGNGFDVNSAFSGKNLNEKIGLVSMKERTESSGGKFRMESSKDKGTTIAISWPVKN